MLKELDKLKPPVEKLKKEREGLKETEKELKTARRRKDKQHAVWHTQLEEKAEEIDEDYVVPTTEESQSSSASAVNAFGQS